MPKLLVINNQIAKNNLSRVADICVTNVLANIGIKTTPPPAPVELAKIAPITPKKLNSQ